MKLEDKIYNYLNEGNLKKDLKAMSKDDYGKLKDSFYKISDGLVGIMDAFKSEDWFKSTGGEISPALKKEIDIFSKIESLRKQSKLGKYL